MPQMMPLYWTFYFILFFFFINIFLIILYNLFIIMNIKKKLMPLTMSNKMMYKW